MDLETLREDYTELVQRYDACEKEYIRLTKQYNAVVQQNRQLQQSIILLTKDIKIEE